MTAPAVMRWLRTRWRYVASAVGPALLAAASLLQDKTLVEVNRLDIPADLSALITGFLITAAGFISTARNDYDIDELQADVARLADSKQVLEDEVQEHVGDLKRMLDTQLELFGRAIGLTTDDRVTLYRHDANQFIMFARYSPNPEYEKPGRGYYPDDQGCIASAWRHGRTEETIVADPTVDPEGYVSEQKDRFGIPKGVTRALNMKSRQFLGLRIVDLEGRSAGVLVFESTNEASLPVGVIEQALDEIERDRLSHSLMCLKGVQPEPEYATREGF